MRDFVGVLSCGCNIVVYICDFLCTTSSECFIGSTLIWSIWRFYLIIISPYCFPYFRRCEWVNIGVGNTSALVLYLYKICFGNILLRFLTAFFIWGKSFFCLVVWCFWWLNTFSCYRFRFFKVFWSIFHIVVVVVFFFNDVANLSHSFFLFLSNFFFYLSLMESNLVLISFWINERCRIFGPLLFFSLSL